MRQLILGLVLGAVVATTLSGWSQSSDPFIRDLQRDRYRREQREIQQEYLRIERERAARERREDRDRTLNDLLRQPC